MMQQGLFAVQLVDEIESPFIRHSKQAKTIGIDSAENEYLLKRIEDGRYLPMTEWLCHHLCRMIGVPTTEFSVVLRPNGEPAFGSRIDSTLIDFNKTALSQARKQAIVKDAGLTESAAIALDAVLPNPDRHFGNWLYALRRNRFMALAIDFGKVTAPSDDPVFKGWPWPPECRSAEAVASLKALFALDAVELRRVWAALDQIGEDDIQAILRSAPELWWQGIDQSAILNWWKNHRP